MRILLIGKSGQLGGSLLRHNSVHNIHAPGRTELDIESTESCRDWIESVKPDMVINTAAFHDLPRCEREPRRAIEVNCIAVAELAALCRQTNALLLTFSTDYVFDGRQDSPYLEEDPGNPLQVYGVSKFAGELAARCVAPEHSVVIRTCGLYGLGGASSKGGNFVDKRLIDAGRTQQLEMSSDQVIAPTNAGDLAAAVLQLIDTPGFTPGTYHLVNEGQCNWYEFTRAIYSTAGIDMEVIPVDRGGISDGFRRPAYSVLANTRARAMGVRLPVWQDALTRYINDSRQG